MNNNTIEVSIIIADNKVVTLTMNPNNYRLMFSQFTQKYSIQPVIAQSLLIEIEQKIMQFMLECKNLLPATNTNQKHMINNNHHDKQHDEQKQPQSPRFKQTTIQYSTQTGLEPTFMPKFLDQQSQIKEQIQTERPMPCPILQKQQKYSFKISQSTKPKQQEVKSFSQSNVEKKREPKLFNNYFQHLNLCKNKITCQQLIKNNKETASLTTQKQDKQQSFTHKKQQSPKIPQKTQKTESTVKKSSLSPKKDEQLSSPKVEKDTNKFKRLPQSSFQQIFNRLHNTSTVSSSNKHNQDMNWKEYEDYLEVQKYMMANNLRRNNKFFFHHLHQKQTQSSAAKNRKNQHFSPAKLDTTHQQSKMENYLQSPPLINKKERFATVNRRGAYCQMKEYIKQQQKKKQLQRQKQQQIRKRIKGRSNSKSQQKAQSRRKIHRECHQHLTQQSPKKQIVNFTKFSPPREPRKYMSKILQDSYNQFVRQLKQT